MARKKIFIKVSGDMYLHPEFLKWIKELSVPASWVVVCPGGGSRIDKEFKKHGFPVGGHGPLGRETATFPQRQLQRDVLELSQQELQDELAAREVFATVVTPSLVLGDVLCPINGDQMVRTVYLGYDELYVVTLERRVQAKEQ